MSTYEQVLSYVLKNGRVVKNRTGVDTLSIFGPEIQIDHDLDSNFPLLTTKTVPFEKVGAELAWFLSGSTRVQDLHPVKIWDAWADPKTGEVGPIYSHLWRRFAAPYPASDANQDQSGTDQIMRMVHQIMDCARDESSAQNRRLVLSAWDPRALPFQALPPCHLLTQFQVRDRRLSCIMTMRSADLFLGVPWNLASYALLTHLFVHTVNPLLPEAERLTVGRIVIRFGDAHIYVNHVEQVLTQLERDHRPFPSMVLRDDTNVYLFKSEDAMVVGYDPHPALPAPVAV